MIYKRLTKEQKGIYKWRLRRNSLISKYQAMHPTLAWNEIMKLVNAELRAKKRKPVKQKPKKKKKKNRLRNSTDWYIIHYE